MANVVLPKQYLTDRIGKNVEVKLKWGQSYVGTLVSFDEYMNIQMKDTHEFAGDKDEGLLGEVLVRCNNVLYVRSIETKED